MAYEGGKRAWWPGSCESRNKEIRHCKRSKWNFNSKMKFAQEDIKPHGVCITVRPIGLGGNTIYLLMIEMCAGLLYM